MSRDAAFIKSAVEITAERPAPPQVIVRLRAASRLGHAFPTGDLFRRLALRVDVEGGGSERRYLAGHFRTVLSGPDRGMRVKERDDRVEVGHDGRVAFDLPGSEGKRVVYRVDYERVQELHADDGHDAVVDGVVELARGTLPP